jgi:hypothetical protein
LPVKVHPFKHEPLRSSRKLAVDCRGLDFNGHLVLAVDRVKCGTPCSLKNIPITMPRKREISGTISVNRRVLFADRPKKTVPQKPWWQWW